jgi:hypothetical protein
VRSEIRAMYTPRSTSSAAARTLGSSASIALRTPEMELK